MERLTKPDGNYCEDCGCMEKHDEFCACDEEIAMYEKLMRYEDAEEQGRLVILPEPKPDIDFMRIFNLVMADTEDRVIVLPCKVGDTVWDRRGEPWTVISVEWFSRKVTQLHCKSPVTGRGMTFSLGKRSLGKTIFLTREEAEKALEGMK